jgi:hypothetical protein
MPASGAMPSLIKRAATDSQIVSEKVASTAPLVSVWCAARTNPRSAPFQVD